MKCKDCQSYKDYYKCCDIKREHVDPEEERECTTASPIAGRKVWIAREQWGDLHIFLSEPHFDTKWSRECWTVGPDSPVFPEGTRWVSLPTYLYPEITFENSPQMLYTL